MEVVAAVLAILLLLWILCRRDGGSGPAEGEPEGRDSTIDDMVLHDEVNPGDGGDVGDASDGR